MFASADYASKATDRRSVPGRIVVCGGTALGWFSRAQNALHFPPRRLRTWPCLSVPRRLFLSGTVGVYILPSCGVPCMAFFEDDQGAIMVAQNPMITSNPKHIDVRHHHLR